MPKQTKALLLSLLEESNIRLSLELILRKSDLEDKILNLKQGSADKLPDLEQKKLHWILYLLKKNIVFDGSAEHDLQSLMKLGTKTISLPSSTINEIQILLELYSLIIYNNIYLKKIKSLEETDDLINEEIDTHYLQLINHNNPIRNELIILWHDKLNIALACFPSDSSFDSSMNSSLNTSLDNTPINPYEGTIFESRQIHCQFN